MIRMTIHPARAALESPAALVVGALALMPLIAHALTPAEVFAKVSPSVWRVRTYDKEGLALGQGSAVVIGPDTLVTNCHVLRKAGRFVVARGDRTIPGTLAMWDTERDLCEVKAGALNAPAVDLAETLRLVVGQPVYAVGNPLGLESTLSAGLLSGLRRNESQQLVSLQTSAPISPGSSGGGLFDDEGRLLGLTTMSLVGGNSQNLNFAIPVDWIRELPQRHLAKLNTGGAAPASAVPAPLLGSWSGTYRCGAYAGSGRVDYAAGFTANVSMTVQSDRVTLTRGSKSYQESVAGTLSADRTLTLEGGGNSLVGNSAGWRTRVTGRFSGDEPRFEGTAQLSTPAGALLRDCAVTLTKTTPP